MPPAEKKAFGKGGKREVRTHKGRFVAGLAPAGRRPLTDAAVRAASSLSSQKGGDPAAPSGTATLLRLHPPHRTYLRNRPPLRVGLATSGTPDSDGVTGGVYKARERIHRAMLMRDY